MATQIAHRAPKAASELLGREWRTAEPTPGSSGCLQHIEVRCRISFCQEPFVVLAENQIQKKSGVSKAPRMGWTLAGFRDDPAMPNWPASARRRLGYQEERAHSLRIAAKNHLTTIQHAFHEEHIFTAVATRNLERTHINGFRGKIAIRSVI